MKVAGHGPIRVWLSGHLGPGAGPNPTQFIFYPMKFRKILQLMLLNFFMMFWIFLKTLIVPVSLQSHSKTRWRERLSWAPDCEVLYPSILKSLDLLLQDKVPTLIPLIRNTVLGLNKYFGFEGILHMKSVSSAYSIKKGPNEAFQLHMRKTFKLFF